MSTHEGHVDIVSVTVDKIEGQRVTLTVSTEFIGLVVSKTYTVNVGDVLRLGTRVVLAPI